MKDRVYIPGDFYRVCDRRGRKIRAADSRKEWTGLIVHKDSWEYRHPQDFVRGVRDDQFVPEPRPRQVDVFQGPLSTKLSAAFVPSSSPWFINVLTTSRMKVGDRIEIITDAGESPIVTILGILSVNQLQISANLPGKASIGNIVTDISAVSAGSIG